MLYYARLITPFWGSFWLQKPVLFAWASFYQQGKSFMPFFDYFNLSGTKLCNIEFSFCLNKWRGLHNTRHEDLKIMEK